MNIEDGGQDAGDVIPGDGEGLPPAAFAPDVVSGTPVQPLPADAAVLGGPQPLAVVGLGASAGGIKALQEFFEGMPADTGFAFVVIMHLSPDYESNLAQVLQMRTTMPVVQVAEPVEMARNHVYVISPNKHMTIQGNKLLVEEPLPTLGKRVAVDLFFRTLASASGQRAVAIVLSGTDSDGAIGIKHIKEQGGVTVAQDPSEAEHDGMPRTAIETGMVDWILPVGQMPARLVRFAENELRMQVPPEDAPDEDIYNDVAGEAEDAERLEGDRAVGGPLRVRQSADTADEAILRDILIFVRIQTGHDFTHYKRATVPRRLARRLQVNTLENLHEYLDFLRLHPAEATALLQDLLISVTNFFRDSEIFTALQGHLPQVFRGKDEGDHVRVWVAGCATGEEAYSLAIMMFEYAMQLEIAPTIQILATDLNEQVVQTARFGLYPTTIEADVSPMRLRRFFTKELSHYRINKQIREMVLFAAHDLLRDPPFSNLDLISCRNLLIYLKPRAQERVFETFHFALRPEALLFLGNSETIDDSHALFMPLDKRHQLYQRRPMTRVVWKPRPLPEPANRQLPRLEELPSHDLPALVPVIPLQTSLRPAPIHPAGTFADLHLDLLEQYAPPSLVVNESNEIVHLSPQAGQFLQFAGGEPSINVLKLVHPALRTPLRAALYRAATSGTGATAPHISIELNGEVRQVSMHVRPPSSEAAPHRFLLVVFELEETLTTPMEIVASGDSAHHLEIEVERLSAQLRLASEQYEVSTEDLKASNEELHAMVEELRSATEELQTGKEELHSVNEELISVNQELKIYLESLNRSNNDLQNLMASTDIGIIFLDANLRIRIFTPRAQELFNLRSTDIDRPLSDITHRLDYRESTADAERVLRDLSAIEREVRSHDGRWYLTRCLPYRTSDNRIDGVVLSFFDLTERKLAESDREALLAEVAAAHEQELAILESISDYFYAVDADFRFTYVNARTEQLWQRRHQELLGRHYWTEFPEEVTGEFYHLHIEAMKERVPQHFELRSPELGRWFAVNMYPTANGGLAVYFQDIEARKAAEAQLRDSEERFRLLVEGSIDYAMFLTDRDRKIVHWNSAAERILGYSREEAIGQSADFIFTPEDIAAGVPVEEIENAKKHGSASDRRWHLRRDGSRFWADGVMRRLNDDDGELRGFVKIMRDATREREAEEQLRAAHDELEARVAERTRELLASNAELTNSEERFAQAFQASSMPTLICTIAAREVVDINDAALRALGRERKEVIGKTTDELGHWQSMGGQCDDLIRQLQKEGSLSGVQIVFTTTGGEMRDAALSLELIELNGTQCLLFMFDDITSRKQAENLREQLLQRIVATQEEERRRISRELHDSMGQLLTVLLVGLKMLAEQPGDEPGVAVPYQEQVAALQKVAQELMEQAHRLAWEVRPAALDSIGLADAVQQYVADWGARVGVQTDFICTGFTGYPRLQEELETALYRVVQESLTNVARHAAASKVSLVLERSDDPKAKLIIEDDGCGFEAGEIGIFSSGSRRLGLLGMRERMELVGGSLTIESQPGMGTTVYAWAPISQEVDTGE